MKVFDTVQAARPDVDPMPLTKRQTIRESLFGSGHGDASGSIARRSSSGAVVSTAPHGIRRPVDRPRISVSSVVKIVAGLAVLGVGGAVAWSAISSDGDSDTTVDSIAAPVSTSLTTAAPAPTTPPVVRTGVSRTSPLVLPRSLLPVDEVAIDPPTAGSSGVLMTAPDGVTVWMGDFDGGPLPLENLDIQQVGALGVAVADQDAASYRIAVPCGIVFLNDAPGQPPFRPIIVDLLNAMSIDGDATIDVSLPAGWSVIDVGAGETSFTAQFQVPVFVGSATVRLTQIPDGSFPQLTFGGRQLAPAQFLGGPAFVDSAPLSPEFVSVFWKDGNTVFNVSSSQLTLADLESFIGSMEPVTSEEWEQRFAITTPPTVDNDPSCAPQPDFGPTLDP